MAEALVIVYSYHHKNTEKIAIAMASALGCEALRPSDVSYESLAGYSIVGFGAGIDSGKHYMPMLEFARDLAPVEGKIAFVFSTSAIANEKKAYKDHSALRDILLSKGYQVIGEFTCKGYNTNSFLKYFGGMNKGHPDSEDLQNAADFAKSLAISL